MPRAKLHPVIENIQGKFMDVELPSLEWIDISLSHKKTSWVHPTTNATDKVEDDFTITINMSKRLKQEDRELSEKIKQASGLHFVPYYYREQSYRFYTTKYNGSSEDKRQMLKNILDIVQGYEKEKTLSMSSAEETFKQDSQAQLSFKSDNMVMKFHPTLQCFVLTMTKYVGQELFSFIKHRSSHYGKFDDPNTTVPVHSRVAPDFFSDLHGGKLTDKFYFLIRPYSYEEVKLHFQKEELLHQQFIIEQQKVAQSQDLSQYNVEQDNVFGLKIKFDPQNNWFEFYGRGYFDPSIDAFGRRGQRTIISRWALNFIYAQPSEQIDNNYDFIRENCTKIDLTVQPGGSKKEKNVRIPADQWEKLKLIKENFLTQNELWGRPTSSIKVVDKILNISHQLNHYPAIFFNKKGKPYLVFQYRQTEVADPNESNAFFKKLSTSMKAIELSWQEAENFLQSHEFAPQIKAASVHLNGVVWAPQQAVATTLPNALEQKKMEEQVFENVFMFAKLNNTTDSAATPKKKRAKI